MKQEHKVFLSELKTLLEKYNASIWFSCGPNSDTFGLYDDSIVVEIEYKEILRTNSWCLNSCDIRGIE